MSIVSSRKLMCARVLGGFRYGCWNLKQSEEDPATMDECLLSISKRTELKMHFYVIYCNFWELDTDHDFLIDKENLIRYDNHALTYRIADRISSQVPIKFTINVEGKWDMKTLFISLCQKRTNHENQVSNTGTHLPTYSDLEVSNGMCTPYFKISRNFKTIN
ncbi:hypothetical protein LXL04_024334 [Taraxacum kok-saghyz]